jgi:hypothetical protein
MVVGGLNSKGSTISISYREPTERRRRRRRRRRHTATLSLFVPTNALSSI